MNNSRFSNLDALRSIACLFVLIAHVLDPFLVIYFPNSLIRTNAIFKFLFLNGSLGVQIFFCLSGFLITWLILVEVGATKKFSVRNFYIRRVLRIWPVYFLVVGFVFFIYVGIKNWFGGGGNISESLWMSLFFLSNFDLIRVMSDQHANVNGMISLTWSVSVEEQFYIIWPWLFVFLIVRPRSLAVMMLLIMGAAVIFIATSTGPLYSIYYHTIPNLLFLGGGGVVALALYQKSQRLNFLLNMSKRKWMVALLVFVMFAIFTAEKLLMTSFGVALYYCIILILVLLVIINQVAPTNRPFELHRIPGFVSLSKFTYGSYMYHRIVGFVLSILIFKVLHLNDSQEWGAILAVGTLIGTLCMSWISYYYLEAPFLRLKDKFNFNSMQGVGSVSIATSDQCKKKVVSISGAARDIH